MAPWHPWLNETGPIEVAVTSGATGRAVARDIFLDGNTFGSGPRVGHERYTASGDVGAQVRYRALTLAYRVTSDSRAYAAGPKWHPWASMIAGLTFGQ